MTQDLTAIDPDNMFDGGDLDCGSGLILLIRDAMRTGAGGRHPGDAQPRTNGQRRPAAVVPDVRP